jgi:hypothetical protein
VSAQGEKIFKLLYKEKMADTTKLILMNLFHIGDVFMIQQIMRRICLYNPHVQIEFVAYNAFYLYKDIAKECPNLTIVDASVHPLRKRFKRIRFMPFVCLHPGVFVVHLWLGALGCFERVPGSERIPRSDSYLEYHYENMYKKVQRIFGHIHTVFGVQFALPDCEHRSQLIPIIPDTDTALFDAWRVTRGDRPRVLYYNFGPRSMQSIGIREEDHARIVLALSAARPDMDVLVPFGAPAERPSNVWSCEESFGCVVSPSCENLCMLAKINLNCNFSVHFDIGACLFYPSQYLYSHTSCKFIHASIESFYYERLRDSFGDSISADDYAKKVVDMRVTADVDACIADILMRLQ